MTKKEGAKKRKQAELDRYISDGLTPEEAEQKYKQKFADLAKKQKGKPKTQPSGFALMSREKHIEISRKGGINRASNKQN